MSFLENILKIKAYIIIIALCIFSFISVFGLYLSMSNGADIDVVVCFDQNDSSCATAIDHITHWQESFLFTIDTQQFSLLLVIAFVATILASIFLFFALADKLYRKKHLTVLTNFFIREFPDLQPLL